MEMICIGFLAGVIFSVILVGAGVIIDDKGNNKDYSTEQLVGSDDNDSISDGRDRNRSRDNRCYKYFGPEEKAIVLKMILNDYKHTLTPHEKDVLESLIIDFDNEYNIINKETESTVLKEKIDYLNKLLNDFIYGKNKMKG